MCVCVCVCVCDLSSESCSDEYHNSLYTALPSYLATANMVLRMVLQGWGGGNTNITGAKYINASLLEP